MVPNVEEHQLSRAIHVGFICQASEEAGERRSELLAALTRSRSKEKHQDAVLQTRHHLAFRVQLVLVRVVLHQDPVNEEIHHDGAGAGWRARGLQEAARRDDKMKVSSLTQIHVREQFEESSF